MSSQAAKRAPSRPETPSIGEHDVNNPSHDLNPRHDLIDYAKMYAREKPAVAAMWCFGIGFILGWKLKPW